MTGTPGSGEKRIRIKALAHGGPEQLKLSHRLPGHVIR